MKNIFITSSGTETGKTFVTTLLVRQLRARGIKVRAIKPLISGYSDNAAEASDTGLLLAAMGLPVNSENIALVSPWRFAAPLAPSMAARREGRRIELNELVEFCRNARHGHEQFLLVEGVGGVMVPLNETDTVCDWIRALEIPALLVGGSYLGSISHTLSALNVLQTSFIPVAAIVVSESMASTVPLDDTVADIARFARGIPVLGLPRLAGPEGAPDLSCLLEETP